MITAVEEELNKKKTANAERGMTGFYTNYISKIRGLNDPVDEEPDQEQQAAEEQSNQASVINAEDVGNGNAAAGPRDFRGRMEDKLKELRQKQTEKEQE